MNASNAILAFAAANPSEARAIFDAAYAAETDPDKRANIELLREYACNPEFKKGLEDYSFAMTK